MYSSLLLLKNLLASLAYEAWEDRLYVQFNVFQDPWKLPITNRGSVGETSHKMVACTNITLFQKNVSTVLLWGNGSFAVFPKQSTKFKLALHGKNIQYFFLFPARRKYQL